jgi:mRNA-degrading endonuclease RelE of RelBE toxin-antitoxin system
VTYRLASAAQRDLRKLPAIDAQVILGAIEALDDRGDGDVKKLKDYRVPTWRLRVGRFRVLFRRESGSVLVIQIIDRRDAYR